MMKLIRRNYFRNLSVLFTAFFILYVLVVKFNIRNQLSEFSERNFIDKHDTVPSNFVYFPDSGALAGLQKIDWSSTSFEKPGTLKNGLGESGEAATLPGGQEKEKEELWDTNGFNALLSDQIALNRTLKDIRNPICKTLKYSKILPTVSVVIPFFEEHWTTLLRTVVSVVNRSPPTLLKEIILVDDGSTMKEFLGSPLEKWLAKNQPIVKVIRMPKRVGLILSRQEGAKAATGDVIVVLDSHCEVMTGWLPPLLDPIVENPHTAVCPLIDVINSESFAYYPQDEGGRGAFDWRFYYKRLPLFPADIKNQPNPFENPVMNGGLFAINRKFFWELGGYDPGLKIWGGEQYDLSFKIWQCGGRLLDAPCSRVGHVFRSGGKKRPAAKNAGDFISVNYKRVALVWMDEYAEALYIRNPRLKTVDAGDVSSELQVRNRLHCKPFSWFLENVAPDLVKAYPPFEPPDFANGTIKSVANPQLCVDTNSKEEGELILYSCHGLGPQYFSIGYEKTLKVESEQFCWEAPSEEGRPPHTRHCGKDLPSTYIWRYDPVTKQLQDKAYKRCLQADVTSQTLSMKTCNESSKSQKWDFQRVNRALIEQKYPNFN